MACRRATALLLLCVALAACAGARPAAPPEPATTTVVMVRHAEKLLEGNDPALSPAGLERARALAHVLEAAGPAALFCSQYRRTRDTLEPLGARLGLAVRVFEIEDVERSSRELAELIRSEFPGRLVVVAGHSNTVPALIEALGAGPAPSIAENQYDDLFVVLLGPGPARLVRLKYGKPAA